MNLEFILKKEKRMLQMKFNLFSDEVDSKSLGCTSNTDLRSWWLALPWSNAFWPGLTPFGPPMWQAEADTELTLSASPTTAVGQKALALAKRRYSTVLTLQFFSTSYIGVYGILYGDSVNRFGNQTFTWTFNLHLLLMNIMSKCQE